MTKNIAIDAKEPSTTPTSIPTTLTHSALPLPPLPIHHRRSPLRQNLLTRNTRKRRQASKTGRLRTLLSSCPFPRNLPPIAQRKKVMIRPRQMRRQDKRESAGRTGARKRADFAVTPTTQIPTPRRLRMASAETLRLLHNPRRKPHHQQTALAAISRFRLSGLGGDGWRGRFHEEVAVVLLVESDAVGLVGGAGGIGARDECAADGDLGSEADDAAGYVRGCEGCYGCVDVPWVGGEEGAEN